MPWNPTIIAQPSSTTTTSPATSSTALQTAPTTNSGLSTGAKAAVGVANPLVFLAAVAGFFCFSRKRKGRRTRNEMNGSEPVGEMDGHPRPRELNGLSPPKEMNGGDRKKDYDYRYTPHELAGGVNSLPPVELG